MTTLFFFVFPSCFPLGGDEGTTLRHSPGDSQVPEPAQETVESAADTSGTDVGDPPVITSALEVTAVLGLAFQYTLTAEQDPCGGPLTCRFQDSHLPFQVSGCTFDLLSNDESLVGMWSIEMEARDLFGDDHESLRLTVQEGGHAPVIESYVLPDAVTNLAYTASLAATDEDGDKLTYTLLEGPSWLTLDMTTGAVGGTPTEEGDFIVQVRVSDGVLSTEETLPLTVRAQPVLTLYVIDGDGGAAADPTCGIEVTVEPSESGTSTAAKMDSAGVARFALTEIGSYDILVPETNTGSNCYGPVRQSGWVDVTWGENTGWIVLIPESDQDLVIETVGDALDMSVISDCGWSGDVDSVTKLLLWMRGGHCRVDTAKLACTWEEVVRTGERSWRIEDVDGFTYMGVDHDEALAYAVPLMEGAYAPDIEIVESGTGGDVTWTREMGGNWLVTDMDEEEDTAGVWTYTSCEINCGGSSSIESAALLMTHEIGHCFGFYHTDIDTFIMSPHPSVYELHPLEALVARVTNQIGNEGPRGYPVQLFDGYYWE